ncbi:MAG: SMC-Scp complex subunit ScpB, partial [Thermoplasmatota archaeon]
MLKPERVVEAALFSAGRPVSVEEIQESTGLDAETIRRTLKKLIRSSQKRDSAFEVARAGTKYCMQVRKELVPAVSKLAQTDIPRRLLKTLALVAYHQPIKQSALLNMVGPKVYDHVKELHKLGMILESPSGQTKILTTSSRFPEYFGIKTTKREEIKKWMAEIVGIKTDGTLVGAKPAPEILATQPAGGGAPEGAGGGWGGVGDGGGGGVGEAGR